MNELKFTGERLVPSFGNQFVSIEHLHRYALAMEFCKDKIVLDIASGEGYGTNLLAKVANMAIGVDISLETINHSKNKYKKSNLEFRVGSTSKIPCETNSVDIVVSFETIEHHDEHDEMMVEISRVLKQDGILIISSPDKSIYWKRATNNHFHVKEISLNEFEVLIKKYFSYLEILPQRIIISSLIGKESEESSLFKTYKGDFAKIESGFEEDDFFQVPFFNIIVASNQQILNNFPKASIFSAFGAHKEKEDDIKKITNSRAYKIVKRFF